jgi:hypothetical protein
LKNGEFKEASLVEETNPAFSGSCESKVDLG